MISAVAASPVVKPSHTPRGGPAALQGFLYQLLISADWAVEIVVDSKDQITLAEMVLEPTEGGDADHLSKSRRTIQVKSRRRAWSLTQIVRNVFPDLYKAVDRGGVGHELVLQSNAAISKDVKALFQLQARLKIQTAAAVFGRSGAKGIELRFDRKSVTPAVFFRRAGAVTSGLSQKAFAQDLEAQERFSNLLRRFVVDPPRSLQDLQASITTKLTQVAVDPSSAEAIGLEMLGRLMRGASEGQKTLSVAKLLEECGIPSDALGGLAKLDRRLKDRLDEALATAGYIQIQDVRCAELDYNLQRAAAFCGPSGAGKTWMLARAALSAQARGARVLWLEGNHQSADIRQRVTNSLQSARGHRGGTINPEALAEQLLTPLAKAGATTPVLICLDRFETLGQSLTVLADPWWKNQGLQVMAALPACDPEAVAHDEVDLIVVPDFSVEEVRAMLRGRTTVWQGLPADMRRWLQRPLLARLFNDIAREDVRFRPETEYELIASVWSAKPRSAGHVGAWRSARRKLRRYVGLLLDDLETGNAARYPWPLDLSPALQTDEREALEASGLLRWAGEESLQLDHDRLLAHALAEVIADRFSSGAMDKDQLIAILKRVTAAVWEGGGLPGRALDYVVMDVFWILAETSGAPDKDLVQALLALSGAQPFEIRWKAWSTLGGRGFRLLAAAFEQLPSGRYTPQEMGECLAAAAPTPLSAGDMAWIAGVIASDRPGLRQVAFHFLVKRPLSEMLAAVVHRAGVLYRRAPDADVHVWYGERLAVDKALSVLACAKPEEFLFHCDLIQDPDQAAAAADAARSLPPSLAEQAWRMLRGRLLPADRDRLQEAFAGIDPGGLEAITEHALGGSVTSSWSFMRLAEQAPDKAVAIFKTFNAAQVLDCLVSLGALRQRLADCEPKLTELMLSGALSTDQVTRKMKLWPRFAGRDLARSLCNGLGPSAASMKRLIWLTEVHSTTIVDAMAEAFMSGLDDRLLTWILSGKIEDGQEDLRPSSLAPVFLRLGTCGFGKLVSWQLRETDRWIQRQGLRNALIGDEQFFAEDLEALARATFENRLNDQILLAPFEALSAVAPARAEALSMNLLEGGRLYAAEVAAEVALATGSQELATHAFDQLTEPTQAHVLYRVRLGLAFFQLAGALLAEAGKLLALKTSVARHWAALVASQTRDEDLAECVKSQLLAATMTSLDNHDVATLHTLLGLPTAAALIDQLRADPKSSLLRRQLLSLNVEGVLGLPEARSEAIHNAFDFTTGDLNAPVEGLRRLWRLAPDLAIEAFDEGLAQGHGAVIETAALAMEHDPEMALTKLLLRLPDIEDEKIMAAAGRSVRRHPDQRGVGDKLAAQMFDPVEDRARAAVELAGWLGRDDTDAALIKVLSTSTPARVRAAAKNALERSDRIAFLTQLDTRRRHTSSPVEQRRLLAIALGADHDLLISTIGDPLCPYKQLGKRERLLFT